MISIRCILVAAALLAAMPPAAGCADSGKPAIFVWAWERKEDLRFLDPQKAGVAFLAKTVSLADGKVYETPRRQPLKISSATYLTAVVRVEAPAGRALLGRQLQPAARAITAVSRLRGVRAVQVDFDAVLSQRKFYVELIKLVRKELPAGKGLSITALVSWCAADNWLTGLPVDEAVPMFFQMGPDSDQIRGAYANGIRTRQPLCSRSAGFSLDEPFLKTQKGSTIYVFSPKAWTPELFRKAEELIRS